MAKGLDCDHNLTDFGVHLKQDGFDWVGRYINPNKPAHLTNAEAKS